MQPISLLKRILSLTLSAVFMMTISMVFTNTVFAADVNTCAGLQAAIDGAGSTPATIYITGNIDFGGATVEVPGTANITIRSEGNTAYTLTQTSGRHFTVSGSLTLEDIILDGSSSGITSAVSGGVDVPQVGIYHGRLTMNSGSVIQNCNAGGNGAGGGVAMTYGTFTMNDGAVIQNCTSDSGGGLLIIASTAIINNGSIKGSKATCGGGVYITGAGGTFTMYDGMIGGDGAGDGNTANYGGGIFAVGTDNKIYIGGNSTGPVAGENPKINANTAYFYGGGVSLGGSDTFTMYKGEINDNKNTNNGIYGVGGGGMHIRAGSTFTFSGGTISITQPSKTAEVSL